MLKLVLLYEKCTHFRHFNSSRAYQNKYAINTLKYFDVETDQYHIGNTYRVYNSYNRLQFTAYKNNGSI